jgi:hypothetical protein
MMVTDCITFADVNKKVVYDVYIAYEICSPIEGGGSEANLDRFARQSLDYMRNLYGEVYGK